MLRRIRSSFVSLIVALLAGCASPAALSTPVATFDPDPCGYDLLDSNLEPLREVSNRFQEEIDGTRDAGEERLEASILRLQNVRAETSAMELPECLEAPRAQMLVYQDRVIGSMAAWALDDVQTAMELTGVAQNDYNDFLTLVNALKEEAGVIDLLSDNPTPLPD